MKGVSKLYFFALAVSGKGISGSDRIFIEFARRWGRKHPTKIFTSNEGRRLCRLNSLSNRVMLSSLNNARLEGFSILNYIYKVLAGFVLGLTLKLPKKDTYFYSASEFLMDSLPTLILKLRYPKAKWLAAWYQTAPNPLKGYSEGERQVTYKLNSFLYWLAQLPIKPIISIFADFVLVNNEEEKMRFPRLNGKGKAIVVLGAVPLEDIQKFLRSRSKPSKVKYYDAVFQGRFHPQKGVVELIDIWRKVVDRKPDAKLAMIGDGPLMGEVKSLISKYGLERNVKVFGYLFDGPEKFKVFAESKLVVHPAFYDSGGMAAAEAMAFGIPAVGFKLKSFESYYPQGMLKVEVGDTKAFADKILYLLENSDFRESLGRNAGLTIQRDWSWENRAQNVLEKIQI